MELAEIIRNVHPISDESLEQLSRLLTPRHIPARQYLVSRGEVSRDVFFVKTGIARNFAVNDSKETTRWFGMEGDVIASMYSFAYGKPALFNIEAITDMETLVGDRDDIYNLIKTNPEWALWTSQYLIGGLFEIERRFEFIGSGDAYTRYENLIQYRTFDELNQIPLQHIASYLNITPQTLSRIRRKMATKR